MEDYEKQSAPYKEYPFDLIHEYIDNSGHIIRKRIKIANLKQYQEYFEWMILCLKSEVLFGDETLSGSNHFVIFENLVESGAYVISPGKSNYYRVFLPYERLIKALEGNGQWLLGVKKSYA